MIKLTLHDSLRKVITYSYPKKKKKKEGETNQINIDINLQKEDWDYDCGLINDFDPVMLQIS